MSASQRITCSAPKEPKEIFARACALPLGGCCSSIVLFYSDRLACNACHGRCIELGMIAGTRLWPPAPAMGPAGLTVVFWVIRQLRDGRSLFARAKAPEGHPRVCSGRNPRASSPVLEDVRKFQRSCVTRALIPVPSECLWLHADCMIYLLVPVLCVRCPELYLMHVDMRDAIVLSCSLL